VPLRLHNTLTGTLERFEPLQSGAVRMYNCGPTVYDFVHIGNLRSYVFVDTLRRTFEYEGFQVKQVMNITDIGHLQSDADEGEDKMVLALRRQGYEETLENLYAVGTTYADAFKQDLLKLNVEMAETLPRASEHIPEQIALIEALEKQGYAYRISNGVYFDTAKLPTYGKRMRHALSGDEAGARVETNLEKHNQRDFALWKLGGTIGWESPWGKGFPGWHTECAAMSMKYLGESFDIHTGGEDLKFPHHENEIAQAEALTRKTFARYFLHNAFVTIANERMAKSKQNFFTLRDIETKGISPLALRYLFLTSHYRSPLHFTWEALAGAQTALNRLEHTIASSTTDTGKISTIYRTDFLNALEDDLNTPQALAVAWNMIKDDSLSPPDKRATLLDMDRVLGLDLEHAKSNTILLSDLPERVRNLVEERETARANKDWAKADALREKIIGMEFEIEDTDAGPRLGKR